MFLGYIRNKLSIMYKHLLFKTFCIMVIFTMFMDMTALSNNITNRDGLWRADSDSVTITTSYSEKQPEKLNV